MGRVMIERPAPVAGRDADIRTYPVKAGESVVAGDVVDVVGGTATTLGPPIGSLAVGSVIKLNVSGVPTEFIIVHHGKPSSIYSNTFTGATILMAKDVAKTSVPWLNGDSNDYQNSTISSHVQGIVSKLDASAAQAVVRVKIPYRPGNGTSTTVYRGEQGLSVDAWIPSVYEVGFTPSGAPVDGAKFSYFLAGTTGNANALRKADKDWWLRTPYSVAGGAYNVTAAGEAYWNYCGNVYGERVVMALKDSFVGYVKEVMPSQAIALQSGTGGQSIDVIFDGTAELPGITAGTSITSPGVQGYAPQDGWVWVRPEWEENYGTKVVTGSYVGTNKSGSANPNVLTFDFVPKLLIVMPESQAECGFVWSGGGFAKRLPYSSSYLGSLFVSLLGYTVSWYESTVGGTGPMQQCNYSGVTYHYAAIG